jgi:tetratricopeptide (TPR) repeat protein
LERQGKLGQAGDFLLEAVTINGQRELAEADTPWRIRLLWEPLNQLGRLQLKLGRGQGAQKYFEKALDIAARLGDVHGEIAARANLASMYAGLNQTAQAFETLSEALALAGRVGDFRALSRLQYNLGLLYVSQNRWGEAQSSFTTSREAALSLGWREGVALNQEELRKVKMALSMTV